MTEQKGICACCFTGHRNVPGSVGRQLRNILVDAIGELVNNGCRTFLSGGAVGFDLLAAEVVLEMRRLNPEIRLVMVLPCKDQHKKWNHADKARYEKIINLADECIFVCEEYCTGCMHLRNKYLVDHSEVCIAYYSHRGGGTEFTVNYAREKEKKLINIGYMVQL